jgi:hypothetical protein
MHHSLRRIAVLIAIFSAGPAIAQDKSTHMLAMSDGVKLATDVYTPRGKGPFPVILTRTPYNKSRQRWGRAVAMAGYVVVAQDMRGRFASGGENVPFVGCGWGKYPDGAQTVAWIMKQSWCNGKIGTMGASAGGITQNLLACTTPKGLQSQYIQVAAGSLFHHAAYVGGALRASQVLGWLKSNRFDPKAAKLMREHTLYDDYWREFDSIARQAVINVPAVHVGGWFDTFCQGTIDSFVGRQYHGAKGAKGTQKLVMGPWAHGIGRPAGRMPFPNPRPPAKYSAIPWFAHTLQGKANGVTDLPPVAYYVMGDVSDKKAPGNEWRYAARWPVPATQTPYYIHKSKVLSPARPKIPSPSYRSYTFDPANPCPTRGGRNLNLPSGPLDQTRVEARSDVLNFTSKALEKPLEVTGRVIAKIYLSSTAADTDVSVRLCDVYPSGKSYLMAEGMLRCRKRESMSKDVPLTPGKIYEVSIDCWSTSIIFNTGHRIRVSITSSNYPRFDRNPGTGKPWADGCKFSKQTNKIYCNAKYPSRIILPIVTSK